MYEEGAVEKILAELEAKTFKDTISFLDFLRKIARDNYIPVMREKTIELLIELVKKKQPKQILEIGTSIGTSAIATLSGCSGYLTTIDKDENVLYAARQNIARLNLDKRCEFICGDCMQVVDMMQGNKYDFIILDGPKGQYLELYQMLFPMLNSGAIMFIDDIKYFDLVTKEGFVERKHRTIVNAMRKFLDRLQSDKNVLTTLYDIEDGIAVAERL